MKILLTVFPSMDIGGIGADILWKMAGLREAGHKVQIVMLENSTIETTKRGQTSREGSTFGEDGLQIHPVAGFYNITRMGYGSKSHMAAVKKFFSKFDFIIHEIPGPDPAKTGDIKGRWLTLYEHDIPQIISAHDANFSRLYPYLYKVAPFIKGISCTNQAGYADLAKFPAPRAFIGAPHPVLSWEKQKSWDDRKAQAVSAHVWKAWKHHDMQVRAIPTLKKTGFVMCGSGIEYHYMSGAKRKEKYGDIWEKAVAAGMDYRGMLSSDDLHKLYRKSRVIVDTAWSKRFMNLGCHFNRSIIEGYNNGCIPVVVHENMYEDGFQLRMFKAGKTHFEIKADHKPKELAELIDHAANLSADEADAMLQRGRKVLLKFFDYRVTSLEYIKLGQGKPAGVYPKLETGKATKKLKDDAEKYNVKVQKMRDKLDRKK